MEKLINESVVLFIAAIAVRLFGGQKDGMFNTACFQAAVKQTVGLEGLSGHAAIMVLSRSGIERIGKAHWRLVL